MTLGAAAFATACSKFVTYEGPAVTRVEVQKANRRMFLLHHTTVLEAYDVQLGFTAAGPKRFEGDGRTPEGRYHIDRRNPDSAFYLSVGIDYPNAADRAFAEAHGRDPGGDIFVHGWGNERRGRSRDWTAGCIAVTNREMKQVYAMVRNGTPIDISA
jgi:murein L,D-transpeptidase YafK